MKALRGSTTITLVIILLILPLNTHLGFSQAPIDANALDGFSTEGAMVERRWEEQYLAVPAAASAREHLRRLTSQPHVAGTKEDYATAVYVRDQLRSYGLTADLKEYQGWLYYPKAPTIVELIAPRRERLAVREAVVPADPTSSNPGITPLFNGYSPSGD